MIKTFLTSLICLSLWFVGCAGLQGEEWEMKNLDGRDYVTLHSLCRFYGLNYTLASNGKDFLAKGRSCEIRFPRSDTREVYINGVHYWLSFALASDEKDWYVSKLDLINVFEPVLRPEKISQPYRLRGVVIDPGHGGSDNGAASTLGTSEKTYTLDTAFRLQKILQAEGMDTVLTRRSDIFVPLEERVNIASRYQNYIFVSIHFNYAIRTAHGLETYALTPRGAGSTDAEGRIRLSDNQRQPGNANDVLNITLGNAIHRQIVQLNPNVLDADRGMKRARFLVLRDNTIPAVLVEGGFLTNFIEASTIDRANYRQALAIAIANGIKNFSQILNGTPPPVLIVQNNQTSPAKEIKSVPKVTAQDADPAKPITTTQTISGPVPKTSPLLTIPSLSAASKYDPTVTIYPVPSTVIKIPAAESPVPTPDPHVPPANPAPEPTHAPTIP